MNWSGLICNLIDQARKYKKISLKNASKVSADFLHVDDASKIIVAALNKSLEGIINGASGKETSILKLAEIIAGQFDEAVEIENNEDDNFSEDRAVVSVGRLKQIIDTDKFLDLQIGIQKMMKS
ncbi:GDP-L-fucose synthase [compost metagenome]